MGLEAMSPSGHGAREKAKAVLDTTSEEKEVLPLASEMPKIVLTRKRKSHKEEDSV